MVPHVYPLQPEPGESTGCVTRQALQHIRESRFLEVSHGKAIELTAGYNFHSAAENRQGPVSARNVYLLPMHS